MDFVTGVHIWAAEGYSAVRCIHCGVVRDGPLYFAPDGERYERAPLCMAKPDVEELIAQADDENVWRAEAQKL